LPASSSASLLSSSLLLLLASSRCRFVVVAVDKARAWLARRNGLRIARLVAQGLSPKVPDRLCLGYWTQEVSGYRKEEKRRISHVAFQYFDVPAASARPSGRAGSRKAVATATGAAASAVGEAAESVLEQSLGASAEAARVAAAIASRGSPMPAALPGRSRQLAGTKAQAEFRSSRPLEWRRKCSRALRFQVGGSTVEVATAEQKLLAAAFLSFAAWQAIQGRSPWCRSGMKQT